MGDVEQIEAVTDARRINPVALGYPCGVHHHPSAAAEVGAFAQDLADIPEILEGCFLGSADLLLRVVALDVLAIRK
ncbi:Lrp/AsnC ligand binding domain-containing protein [Arthrobacter sp. 4R501]|uniref:Lrp/AsnC ligand binding domain-containing protein n=1 Tax=Arthrobacter sp. 4R501 TaxID=2058886 RepID=UPI00215774C0|nr:Lrp/AsnC ligand binding domain-containing protein [Arthrobacter sp. 4R501]